MKIKNLFLVPVVSLLFVIGCTNGQTKSTNDHDHEHNGHSHDVPEAVNLTNNFDSLSYAWGINLGSFLKNQGYEKIDFEALNKALDQMLKGEQTLFTNEEAQKLLQAFAQKQQQQNAPKQPSSAENEAEIAKYKAASAKFLAENKKKPGVKTLPSGLQYKIDKEGTGPVAQKGDKVVAHYHGTLTDGTVFDSSVDRGQPFEFNVGMGRVIKGWDEAFGMMPVGSKWTLYIPSDLAYGDHPRPGGAIKAGMALIFEVELLDIKPAQ
ncbi:MAG: FKBP-type peptidyl-prolyl cis-trans isomerase [Bacteroidota bacterium]|nr:FKBP-type peptidyl-prolyl cis-trans isomerase [Bacteroidota bacterium]